MNKKLLVPILFLIATTTGCSLAPYQQPPAEPAAEPKTQTPPTPLRETPKVVKNDRSVKEKLYSQHREWKGTRYVLGGMSKRGIDCSGLVVNIYRDHLGVKLPRTTKYQSLVGKAVKRSQLRAGDLVFFKTGANTRHVGIYIEDNKFLHASTKHGVKISRLTDYYWRDRYWQARRV